jgi:hypothetical protein
VTTLIAGINRSKIFFTLKGKIHELNTTLNEIYIDADKAIKNGRNTPKIEPKKVNIFTKKKNTLPVFKSGNFIKRNMFKIKSITSLVRLDMSFPILILVGSKSSGKSFNTKLMEHMIAKKDKNIHSTDDDVIIISSNAFTFAKIVAADNITNNGMAIIIMKDNMLIKIIIKIFINPLLPFVSRKALGSKSLPLAPP